MRTSARGLDHITTSSTDGADSGNADLPMGDSRGQFGHG